MFPSNYSFWTISSSTKNCKKYVIIAASRASPGGQYLILNFCVIFFYFYWRDAFDGWMQIIQQHLFVGFQFVCIVCHACAALLCCALIILICDTLYLVLHVPCCTAYIKVLCDILLFLLTRCVRWVNANNSAIFVCWFSFGLYHLPCLRGFAILRPHNSGMWYFIFSAACA